MTNQPPSYQTATEVLDRARALFALADHELVRGTASTPHEDISARLWRAQTYALVAGAGAQVAQAMMAQADVDAAEEVDRHLGTYPTPLGQPIPTTPKILDALRERTTDTTVEPPHPFLRQQPASSTHCRWVVGTGRSCNRPPTDPVHADA